MLLGLLAVAAVPAAVAVTRFVAGLELLDAWAGIPVAALLGLVAISLARRARFVRERTLGRVGGERTVRLGRALGVLGICVAVTAALAVGFYAVLELVAG